MGFILSYIAIILFVFIYLLDSIIILIIDVKNRKWFRTVNKQKYTKAFDIDVFANYLFPKTWNLLLGSRGYQFGRFGETLSSAIGRKYIENSLSWFGYFIYYFLYLVDFSTWKAGGHCKASIMHDYQITNYINKLQK